MEIKPYLRRPQFYETDGMSIIWHGNYVRWMEESRTDFMDQLGFPYARAVEAGIDFALTDISCKYRAKGRPVALKKALPEVYRRLEALTTPD